VARAPFECVCGFTAGTSFAWEKHLALRNTPYSSVKHSRVIRAGGDAPPVNRSYDSETLGGLSRLESERHDRHDLPDYEISAHSVPYPTPKALFRDRPSTYGSPQSLSSTKPLPSTYARPSSPTGSRGVINGIRLQEAAKRGDMDRVARLAVEILRLAQQGDPDGVLDVISDRSLSPTPVRDISTPARKSPPREIKFSANITAVHQAPSGIAIEQVVAFLSPTLLFPLPSPALCLTADGARCVMGAGRNRAEERLCTRPAGQERRVALARDDGAAAGFGKSKCLGPRAIRR